MHDLPTGRSGRARFPRLSAAAIAAVLIAASIGVIAAESRPATAATVSFSQCNDRAAGPGGAPLTVTCSVSVVNTIDASGGTSAVIYSRICALNACTGDTTSSTDVINAVHQCNGSNNVGGSTTTCSADIVTTISLDAPAPALALTLNQCIGSGAGDPAANMTGCLPSSDGSATVTQCNGSGNGGGAFMTCSASGTTSASFPVTVDQCNGSENGGGSVVTCDTTMTANVVDTTAPPQDVPGGTTPTPDAGTPNDVPGGAPPTDTPSGGPPDEWAPPAPPILTPPRFAG